jgi:hypothetical protein
MGEDHGKRPGDVSENRFRERPRSGSVGRGTTVSTRSGQVHGLILQFRPHPVPLYIAYIGLSAFVDVDVFDGDFLLPFAPMSTQRLKQCHVSS